MLGAGRVPTSARGSSNALFLSETRNSSSKWFFQVAESRAHKLRTGAASGMHDQDGGGNSASAVAGGLAEGHIVQSQFGEFLTRLELKVARNQDALYGTGKSLCETGSGRQKQHRSDLLRETSQVATQSFNGAGRAPLGKFLEQLEGLSF